MRVLEVFTADDFPETWPYSADDLMRMDESPE
jgi:hypothetical protein